MDKNQYKSYIPPEPFPEQKENYSYGSDRLNDELEDILYALNNMTNLLYLICKVFVERDFGPETLESDLAAIRLGLTIPRRSNRVRSNRSRCNGGWW